MEHSWIVLIFIALALGLRHGFDLDHLATIDSITRTINQPSYLSKMVGFLFSLGHGLVVTSISLIIGSGCLRFEIPPYLNQVGNCVSIVFLFTFGLLTLCNVLKKPAPSISETGILNFIKQKIQVKKHKSLFIMLVGALFAFSMDTFSQVALFSLSASALSGWIFAVLLGITFTLGMMLADGLNGLLVAILIKRADSISIFASRAVGLAIAFFSLITGIFNLTK